MNTKVEGKVYRFDSGKWLLVAAIILGGAFANSYYSADYALLYRVLAMVVLGIFAAFVAVNTAKGSAFWSLLKASQVEIRKVIWPTRQETIQTTVMVVIVVIITGIILWGLDAVFGYIASRIIG